MKTIVDVANGAVTGMVLKTYPNSRPAEAEPLFAYKLGAPFESQTRWASQVRSLGGEYS